VSTPDSERFISAVDISLSKVGDDAQALHDHRRAGRGRTKFAKRAAEMGDLDVRQVRHGFADHLLALVEREEWFPLLGVDDDRDVTTVSKIAAARSITSR